MDERSFRTTRAEGHTRASSRSRSRSRERAALSPRRQLRSESDTRTAAAVQVAYANHPRSISRLHDDELSCVLPFLSLTDLSQLVRCSHRFNGLARKERSRGLHLEGDVTVVPLASSSLRHHVTSIHLQRYEDEEAQPPVTLATLRELRALPQLTALQLNLHPHDASSLMRRLTLANAVGALQLVLPTQLRSFKIYIRSVIRESSAQAQLLSSSILAAIPAVPQLTKLNLGCDVSSPEMRLTGLMHLPHLRTLTMFGIRWTDERLTELKQLSQLRELSIDLESDTLIALCQPPHSLRLEHIDLCNILVDEAVIRALLHLPIDGSSTRLPAARCLATASSSPRATLSAYLSRRRADHRPDGAAEHRAIRLPYVDRFDTRGEGILGREQI
jgi:hypothetical protein